jgi:hypothetical protein
MAASRRANHSSRAGWRCDPSARETAWRRQWRAATRRSPFPQISARAVPRRRQLRDPGAAVRPPTCARTFRPPTNSAGVNRTRCSMAQHRRNPNERVGTLAADVASMTGASRFGPMISQVVPSPGGNGTSGASTSRSWCRLNGAVTIRECHRC